MSTKVLLYYHFSPIKDPEEFANHHLAFCKTNGLKGRILVSKQGINGTCAGRADSIERYKEYVRLLPGFKKIWFKEHEAKENPFKKMLVRHREKLVAFNKIEVDPEEGGKHISPEKLNELYSQNPDDLVIIDMRNDIEYKVGHFQGAINPEVKHFRDVPKVMEKFKDAKDKTVVMYCTGGVRCELATPFFRKQGFKKVYQLNGGIYNYCQKFPKGKFKGDCFVFDERMSINFTEDGVKTWKETPKEEIVSDCEFCGEKSNRVVNDESKGGRELVICCESCDRKLDISRPRTNEEYAAQQKR